MYLKIFQNRYYKKLNIKLIALLLIICIFAFSKISAQIIEMEMRGVWISTAYNLDYPSMPGLNAEQQQKEFIDYLNICKSLGINALFVQIRPAGDAFYPTELAPWSKFLTGEQGKAPSPYYDPLKFMIEECKKNNMEFHAWMNPFRALIVNSWDLHITKVAGNNPINTKPHWFFKYGNTTYFNPGEPEVRDYVIKIIMEVVNNYDIDGIHFDDYFYPYKIDSLPAFDADWKTFNKYKGNFNSRADWRRENINMFISALYDSIQSVKPQIKFGVSPPGVWRNISHDAKGSNTRGLSAYDELYADVITWLKNGWIDYVVPQLYWEHGNRAADYDILLKWWLQNTYGRHLYIGHATYRLNENAPMKAWRNGNEVIKQIRKNKNHTDVRGSIFFSAASLKQSPLGLNDSLMNIYAQNPAVPPVMEWKTTLIAANVENTSSSVARTKFKTKATIDNNTIKIPETPTNLLVKQIGKNITLQWEHITDNDSSEMKYIIYRFWGEKTGSFDDIANIFAVSDSKEISFKTKRRLFCRKYTFVVTAINSEKIESKSSKGKIIKMI